MWEMNHDIERRGGKEIYKTMANKPYNFQTSSDIPKL